MDKAKPGLSTGPRHLPSHPAPRPQRRSLSAAIDIATQQLEVAMVAGDDVRAIRLRRVLCRLEERIPKAGSGPAFDVDMPR